MTARNLDNILKETTVFPSTLDLSKSVKIFPNGEDSSTIGSAEVASDFIDNEIFNGRDEKKEDFATLSSTKAYQPSLEFSTRVSFSSSTSVGPTTFRTTEKPFEFTASEEIDTTNASPSTVQTTLETTRTSSMKSTTQLPSTKETFIERNYKLLQQLLAAENARNAKAITTQAPFITTTEAPPTTVSTTSLATTERTIESTTEKVTTTQMPTTTREPTTKRRTTTTQAPTTRRTSTTTTTEPPTTQAPTTRRTSTTTTTEPPTTQAPTTRRTSTTTTTEPPTTQTTTPRIIRTTKKLKPSKAPFSDVDDLTFLVTIISV